MTSGAPEVTHGGAAEKEPEVRSWRRFAAPFWTIVAPYIVVGGVYLLPFLLDATRFPYGSDHYGYAWRAAAVHARVSRLSRAAVAPVLGLSGVAVAGLLVGRLDSGSMPWTA